MGIPQIIQLAGKIVITLAIGWLLVVLVDTAWGQTPLTTPGGQACILRPATILHQPVSRSVIVWERLSRGWPQPVEAVPYLAGISHIDYSPYRAATAAAAIQYSIALDPTGTLGDMQMGAWIPDAPTETLAQVVRRYLISGSWRQRDEAAAALVAAMGSSVNDACNQTRN
jgi:hypothetical protein